MNLRVAWSSLMCFGAFDMNLEGRLVGETLSFIRYKQKVVPDISIELFK